MKVNKIKLKIYLKDKKYPLVANLPNERYSDDLLSEISGSKEFITFGEVTFKRTDVRLVVVKRKGD